jgi:SAM-dependent methyltransferase
MAARGWQVVGIELSEKAGEMARSLGYAVHAGPLATAPEPRVPYDLVVGWMVLEHLHDPIHALQLLQRWTTPGGWLVLSVPDAGSVEFRIFKDAWYGLHLPNHLYHYTQDTLQTVLQRGGWKIERVFWHRNARNFLEGLRYRCDDRGWEMAATYLLAVIKGRRQRVARMVLGKCLGMLHASGRMTVWARRA